MMLENISNSLARIAIVGKRIWLIRGIRGLADPHVEASPANAVHPKLPIAVLESVLLAKFSCAFEN